jgi:hypothetical protein
LAAATRSEGLQVLRKDVASLPEEESLVPRLVLGGALLAESVRTYAPATIIGAVETLRVSAQTRPDDLEVLRRLTHALILDEEFGPAEITMGAALPE